ncbi:MAG: Rne/Rng family ribonuclease [Balneolales bacterium]|nr:Rne/Rng family ribonuclease [Balneolales bacterium]
MDNQIVIHASGEQKRIALIENGELAQFFIESPENRRSVGDIYLASVHKVMSGIRAAFIDLSTPKDGFLHYSDLGDHLEEYLVMLNGRDSVPDKASAELREFRAKMNDGSISNMSPKEQTVYEQNLIGNLLKPGQKVIVQVVKEPIGSKGPRVSTDITLAGRFLVLIPFGDYVAVSKRIRSYKERRRLRSLIGEMLPNGFGVIVRTVAEAQDEEALREDLKDLHDKWEKIRENLTDSKPTALLHRDLDMTESLVRDLFSKNYNRILIDDAESFKTIKSYIGKVAPSMVKNVQLYKGKEHVFDHMNISKDVNSIFSPRVKMPSGGYLIFEQTEAMYVVDVNSGRYAAKKAQEDNSLKTNLEAAREIGKQLRLRDIGGIIVVDFIDLAQDSNRKKIYDEIKKEFKKDRAKTNILPMSDFGLMQITRQRIRPSVVKSVSKVCPMCGGSGSIVSENTLLSDIDAWISKFKHSYSYRSVDLYVNPFFHSVLCQGLLSTRIKWMFKYFIHINVISDESVSLNDFKASLRGSDFDIYETVFQGGNIEEAIKENEKSLAELGSGGRRNEEYLDIYRKNGKNGKDKSDSDSRNGKSRSRNDSDNDTSNRSSKSNTTEDKSQGDNPRKRPAPVRITPQARGNTKIKSKYFRKADEEEKSNEQKNPVSDQKPEKKIAQDTNDQKSTGNPEENISDKPDALAVARAYARKVQKEEAKEQTKSKEKEAPKPKEAVVNKDSEVVSAQKEETENSVNEKIDTETKADITKTSKADSSKNAITGEVKETDSDSDSKRVKAPKKVKNAVRPPRKKAIGKSQRSAESKEEQVKPEAKKNESTENSAAEKDDPKSVKLREMDAIKATLDEDYFRKPVARVVSEEKSDQRVKETVLGKKEPESVEQSSTVSKPHTEVIERAKKARAEILKEKTDSDSQDEVKPKKENQQKPLKNEADDSGKSKISDKTTDKDELSRKESEAPASDSK